MAAKITKVTLINNILGVTESFEVRHAERLLRMQNNGGWQLPENSNYIFDYNNGIDIRGHKKKDPRSKKEGGNQPRNIPSESD